MTILRARGLSVRYGAVRVLDRVDVEVGEGEVVALLGPSGAGKSTLFRVLAGELSQQAGSVELAGVDVSREPLWRRVGRGLGYLPQTPSVLFDLSVADNISTFERVAGAVPREPELRMQQVGLDARLLERRARDLSGGERRRLELLRALVTTPKVLLLDEPLAGVDPGAAGVIGQVVREVADAGAAVLVADHRVREVLHFVDRAGLLLDGAIGVWAQPDAFEQHPDVRERYLG